MDMIINNIFSMFDPSSSYWSSSWLTILALIIILNTNMLKNQSNQHLIVNHLFLFVLNEIDQILENNVSFTNTILLTVFFILFILNIVAIFPYNFTLTAHISISFSLSVCLWLSTILFGWSNHFNNMIIHLTPIGTPNTLINFIVLIEIISALIRPITLSIRLSANMIAGHLLISLLSSFSMNTIQNTFSSLIPMSLLVLLEIGVALVQAYVFMTLILLYQNETC